MSERTSLALFFAAITLLVPGATARADDGPVIAIALGGRPTDLLALAKGRPAQVTVTVDGKPAAQATWSSFPAGLMDVRDDGGGRATVTARRDIYDDPDGKEPRGRLVACVESSCYSVGVVGLIDAAGLWHAHIEVGGIIGANKDLDLVQDGRRVSYGGVVLKLEGTTLRAIEGGGTVTRLSGSFTGPSSARGTWASPRGLSGTWSVTR